jgi:Mlc titration factor MtfA (ptsG expression regulator)
VREKAFVGCNGLEVTDQMRVLVAAHACILLINRPGVPNSHLYDDLMSILLYPTGFIVHETDEDEGIVTMSRNELSGQAWDTRRIILSWEDVQRASSEAQNVVVHEFAHYLDLEDETMDGAPALGSASDYADWSSAFWDAYEELIERVEADEQTLLDPYAATEPAEFFAVATETFFQQASELKQAHPRIYEQLSKYYRLDPAAWREDDASSIRQ